MPLATREGSAARPLRFQLAIAESEPALKPATFKVDGKRFINTDSTIKLGTGRTYDFTLTAHQPISVRPGSCLLKLSADRESEVAWEWTDASNPKDPERTILKHTWKCPLEISKKNQRVYAWLSFYVEDFGLCTIPMVLKVYHPEDPSRNHGYQLRYVQYEFRPDPSSSGNMDNILLQSIIYFKY